MTEEEFRNAIYAIEEYTTMLEAVQSELFRLKSEVKEHMKLNDLSEVYVDGKRVRLQETHRNHLDVKTLKQTQPDTYQKFCKRFDVSRLIIS